MSRVICPRCSKRAMPEIAYLTSSRIKPCVCSECKSRNYISAGRKFVFMAVCSLFFWGVVILSNHFDFPYQVTFIVLPALFFFAFKLVFFNAKWLTI